MKNRLMRYLLATLILGFPICAVAQNPNYDECEVAVGYQNGTSKVLGSFTTIMGEEELTLRSLALPRTKLFVVASVYYTDESMATEENSDSMILELILSRDRNRRNLKTSLGYARAELPAAAAVGRVTMLARPGGRQTLVIMECRRRKRS
jgi:hypothetical protein